MSSVGHASEAVLAATEPSSREEASGARPALVALAAAGLEGALAALLLLSGLPLLLGLVVHVGLLIVLAHWLSGEVKRGHDTIWPMLVVLCVLVAGPIGALLAAAAIARRGHSLERPEMLKAWYDRIALSTDIDPATRLCENVAIGRTMDLSAPAPRPFREIVAGGTLTERQTALGLIARKFHPAYIPALQEALRSPEPVVRVQAAAVAARVKGELKAKVNEVVGRPVAGVARPEELIARACYLDACARSGFLDQGDRLRAEALAGRLKDPALAAVRERLRRHGVGLRAAAGDDLGIALAQQRDAVEQWLIGERDFKSLRVLRRVTRAVSGLRRIRRGKSAERARMAEGTS